MGYVATGQTETGRYGSGPGRFLVAVCWLGCCSCLVSPDADKWKNRQRDARADTAPLTDAAEPGDALAPDLAVPPPDADNPERSLCSPQGVLSLCDPIEVQGCYEGSCYLIPLRGVSCVCPDGTIATGDLCTTTTDCAPGNVCAGFARPGVCRVTCDPASPSCATGMQCTPINGFPQYGYCEP